ADEEPDHSEDGSTEDRRVDEETTPSTRAVVTTDVLTTDTNATNPGGTHDPSNQLEFVSMVVAPLAALVILLLSVILIAIYLKSKRPKQVPSSQGSPSVLQTYEPVGENLKVPIFEEDTPSVMEIEMEELDKWMNSMNRNADYEGLPTLKEEKEPNHSPSDNES
ncbi:hypothetical protein STEG23_004204, partial [Scotinomys teguina]